MSSDHIVSEFKGAHHSLHEGLLLTAFFLLPAAAPAPAWHLDTVRLSPFLPFIRTASIPDAFTMYTKPRLRHFRSINSFDPHDHLVRLEL